LFYYNKFMTSFFPAKILKKIPMAQDQYFFTVEVPDEVRAAHKQPGQYVLFDVGDDDKYPMHHGESGWAGTITNRPGRKVWEFLVKDISARSKVISSMEPGDEFRISLPKGEGFNVREYRDMHILLACCGVAIASMRAIVEEILTSRKDWKDVYLFYGERHLYRFAFSEEMESWHSDDIKIFRSASKPDKESWRGNAEYIQDYFYREIGHNINLGSETIAVIAGKPDMVTGFADALNRWEFKGNISFLNR